MTALAAWLGRIDWGSRLVGASVGALLLGLVVNLPVGDELATDLPPPAADFVVANRSWIGFAAGGVVGFVAGPLVRAAGWLAEGVGEALIAVALVIAAAVCVAVLFTGEIVRIPS